MRHDASTDGQAQPSPFRMRICSPFRLPKGFEHLLPLVDGDAGSFVTDIDLDTAVQLDGGDRVKIRIVNEPHSDHPMQHPIHFHGQRFRVLSRDGVPNENLMWKDTVLIPTGQTVDILMEASNPGTWMTHCHIAEHLESHMMLTVYVQDEAESHGEHHHHG